ncbi:hypothetical protein LJB86_02640, partial [Deltaproteobacteria bacterium OttesenSCG-928-M10]|nr:hypothetical protein [Deltaproteobacteria bacterium OttesenSCG-928-M10]
MHRIDTKYVAESLPAPAEIETFPGWFQGGDPESETPGTVVGPDWCNAVQEELLAVAAESGEEPSKEDNGQVLKGVKEIVKQSPEVKSAQAAAQAAADEAGAARTAASEAKTQAAGAEALAEAADQKADEANAKASQALAVAGQSSGAYWVHADAVDAEAFFPTPGNYYLAGDLTNFPLPGPLWFKNEHSEDAENPGRPGAVTYTVWNAASP